MTMRKAFPLIILLLSSLAFGQNTKIKTQKSPIQKKQLKTQIKLPILVATSANLNKRNKAFIPKTLPKNTQTMAPKALATASSALDVTVGGNKLSVSRGKASLDFKGTYNSRYKEIEFNIESRYSDYLNVYFKAKKGTTYRVRLSFKHLRLQSRCTNPSLLISMGGRQQSLPIKRGDNALDFLVRSDVTGEVGIRGIFSRIQCGGSAYRKNNTENLPNFRFGTVRITELKD